MTMPINFFIIRNNGFTIGPVQDHDKNNLNINVRHLGPPEMDSTT